MAESLLSPILVYKNKEEMMPFRKIVVPSSMRSGFWKFFGFPADDNNHILTKTKIVCCICRAFIAYNKNTTNLSTHLNAKHPEVVSEFFNVGRKRSVKSIIKGPKPIGCATTVKRMGVEASRSTSWQLPLSTAADDVTVLKFEHEPELSENGHPTGIAMKDFINEPESSEGYRISEDGDDLIEMDYSQLASEEYEFVAEGGSEDDETNPNEIMSEEYLSSSGLEEEALGRIEAHEEVFEASPDQLGTEDQLIQPFASPLQTDNKQIAINETIENFESLEMDLLDFLIADLVSIDIIEGKGFQQLISKLCTKARIPSKETVQDNLLTAYNSGRSKVFSNLVSMFKDSTKPFSLGLEKWSDGGRAFVAVSINYLCSSRSNNQTLRRQIHSIVDVSTVDWRQFFKNQFPEMSDCSAVLSNYELTEDHELKNYLDGCGIPTIQSFSGILQSAVDKCFSIPLVENTFTAILEFMRTGQESCERLPEIHNGFWMTKYNLLTAFLEYPVRDESSELLEIARSIVDCLTPLKNCLEILSQEPLTFASLMKPMAQKLVEEQFMAAETSEESIEEEMKQIIYTNLTEKILSNRFLLIASFMDPRFQNLAKPSDIVEIKNELEKLCSEESGQAATAKPEIQLKNEFKQNPQRKSGLSSLFGNRNAIQKTRKPKNRFEIEFRSYFDDVNVDFEQCPLTWWSESEYLYPNFKRIVQRYLCVPCSVDDHRRSLEESIIFTKKRNAAQTDDGRKLLWLHYSSADKID